MQLKNLFIFTSIGMASLVACSGSPDSVNSIEGEGNLDGFSSEGDYDITSSEVGPGTNYSSWTPYIFSSSSSVVPGSAPSQGDIPTKVDSTGAVVIDFGECTEAEEGTFIPNTVARADSIPYLTCDSLEWRAANARELDILNLPSCTSTIQGKVVEGGNDFYPGVRYYTCSNQVWINASNIEKETFGFPQPCTNGTARPANVGNSTYICEDGVWVKKFYTKIGVSDAVPVDYSAGRAMNKKLGHGINLGNAWDSDGNDDNGWYNNIENSFFGIIKNAGFNSVRIPVRWQKGASNNSVSSSRLSGVKEDINLAIKNGLIVIVNFHHYLELNDAGNSSQSSFNSEKQKFLNLWAQVAREMNSFADDQVVLEILNEPTISNAARVDTLMNQAYRVIRQNAPGKTIMFEAYHAAKFADIMDLHMPADGNIIYSGHYYEPYTYTHQGSNGYDCKGDATFDTSTIASDFNTYVALAKALYPDINGTDFIPMNMGEFGVAGQGNDCGNAPSDSKRVAWTKSVIAAANSYGISWHYWNFSKASGFEAYDRYGGGWKAGFLDAFGN